MSELLDFLFEAVKSGRKLEFEDVKAKPDLHNVSMRYTRLGKTGEGMADADYIFDFANLCWEKEMHCFSDVERGEIPADAAERFLQKINFVLDIEPGCYHTETERHVPVTEEERYTLGIETLRLTGCEFVIAALYYRFKWVAEIDTDEPYGKLYQALESLRKDCSI